jgi:monofunctional biosynthetic peptidoglycan transglycosylase
MKKRAFAIVFWLLAGIIVVPALVVLAYRVVPPPITPLMVLRDGPSDYRWVPLSRIAPALVRSVMTAEDEAFCTHTGFDKAALEKAWDRYQDDEEGKGTLRGGSTISQQTAKNVLLWPGRTWLRKGLEAVLTVYLELAWDKKRIIEVYLNIVEWGKGVYGAEAAAQHHFHKSARDLTPHEAALLAAVLPSPLKWSATNPGPYVRGRADTIEVRAQRLGALGKCL